MNLEPLPPIPSPAGKHWREFRVRYLPVVAFGTVSMLAVWLWGQNLANPLLVGTAEGFAADLSSPVAGRLTQLAASPGQEVAAGDVLAVVDAQSPEVLSNTVAVIRAEMDQIRSDAGFDSGDRVRYAQFQLDCLVVRADLLSQQAQLNYATQEFERVSKLYAAGKIAGEYELGIARRDREQAEQLVAAKTRAVEQAEHALNQLDPAASGGESPSVRAALSVAEAKLRLTEAEFRPAVLTAPFAGQVSKVTKWAGALVAANDPIVTVVDPKVTRIVAYLPQPLRIEPRVGMMAEVRSRGGSREVRLVRVAGVGPRIELFDAPLRVRGMASAQERGLPIFLEVPPDLKLRPGELVDISLSPRTARQMAITFKSKP